MNAVKNVIKQDILQTIDALPTEAWEELSLLIDYLKFKTLFKANQISTLSNPEGAFPELDLSYEVIEASLRTTWQDRQARLT